MGSLYRHPHDNFDEFFTSFSHVIEKIRKKFWIIILGDFNIDANDYSCMNVRTYKNLLLSLGLRNLINLPTRVTESTETVIDHIVTNLPPASIESGIIQEDISDHYPIHAIANLKIKKPTLPAHHFRRKFPYSKKPKFLDTLKSRLENYPDPTPDDCVSSFINFISIFQLTGEQVFPATKLSCKDRKRYKHPWMTAGILKSREKRFYLLKRSLELKTPESRQIYKRFRNKYTHIIEAAKANYHGKGFEDIGTDVTKTWKKINEMKNTNMKSKSTLPEKLVVNGTELHDKHDIANHLNKHFVQKGPNLAAKLPNVETSIYKTMGQRNPCSMILNDTSDSEVVNTGNKFDINKSTGVHNIPAVLIKWAIYINAPILAKFFNIFMRLGIYPDTLKVAKVTPLHKNDNKRPRLNQPVLQGTV